jgi:hypothetical protein
MNAINFQLELIKLEYLANMNWVYILDCGCANNS